MAIADLTPDQVQNTLTPDQLAQLKAGNFDNPHGVPGGSNTPPGSPASPALSNPYLIPFKDKPYFNDPTFQNIVKQYQGFAGAHGSNNAQSDFEQLSGYVSEFENQFNNYVGRAPTQAEYGQFFSRLQQDSPWNKEAGQFGSQLPSEVTGLLSQYFTKAAQDQAEKVGQDKANAAVAPGSAFDTWQQAYKKSITDLQSPLSDYAQRLMDKLKPNLLTSMYAMGKGDTGALDMAFAGSAKDLTQGVTDYLTQAGLQANQDIANTRYDITSSPSNYSLSSTFSMPQNLTASGQTALNNVFQGNLSNQYAQLQQNMLNQQYGHQPSLLNQYGGLILGGVAGGLGQSFGRGL